MTIRHLETGEPFIEIEEDEICSVMDSFFAGVQFELEPHFDYGEGLCIYRAGLVALPSASAEVKNAAALWNEISPNGLFCTAASAICLFMDILKEQLERGQ